MNPRVQAVDEDIDAGLVFREARGDLPADEEVREWRTRGRAPPIASAEAGRAGAVVSPGRHWFPAEPTGPFLRLSYVGAGAGDIVRGMEILADVLGRPGGLNAAPPN